MKPIVWCFVLGHKWVESGRTEFRDGIDVSGECTRCDAAGTWNTTQGTGKPEPKRPTWDEVKNAHNNRERGKDR